MSTIGAAQLDQNRRRHLAEFATDFPKWTVFTAGTGGERHTWVAVPVPATTALKVAGRIASGRVVAETPTALRAALTRRSGMNPPTGGAR